MNTADKKAQVLDAVQNKTKLNKSSLTGDYKIKGEKVDSRPNENYEMKDYPANTPKETILREVPAGEVAQIGGKLYANDGSGNLLEIKMRKETFERLFPQKDKFEMHQGMLGDCYLISAFDAMMDTPQGRVALYRAFEEKDGDMYIKLPESNLTIKFNDCKPVWVSSVGIHKNRGSISAFVGKRQVDGCDGIKLLEQAYALQRNSRSESGVKNANDIFFMTREMHRADSGGSDAAAKDIAGRENVEQNDYYCSNAERHKDKGESFDDFVKVLEENDPNRMFFIGFDVDNQKYGFHSGHAYRISSYDPETKTVGIVNPWNTNKEIKIPLYELSNIASLVNGVKIKPSNHSDYPPAVSIEQVNKKNNTPQPDIRGVASARADAPENTIASLRNKMFALKDVDGEQMFSAAEIGFIQSNYTPDDIKRLDKLLDSLQEYYRTENPPDVSVRNSFTSIITNQYFRETKDFDFVDDVLNFQSDVDKLYDSEYMDIFFKLDENKINTMKDLMELAKDGDNPLLQNIHNIKYIAEVMTEAGFDRFDIATVFKMKDENGKPVMDSIEFGDHEMDSWKNLNLPISSQKLERLGETLKTRFEYITDADLNNILSKVKDSSDARYLSKALEIKNAEGDPVFNLDTIDYLMDFLSNNQGVKRFLDRFLPKLERTSLKNMDAPLKEIFTYVKDKKAMYLMNEFIKPFSKQADINWRVIGMICHNMNTLPEGKKLEALAINLSQKFIENEDNLYVLSQVDDDATIKMLDKMLARTSKGTNHNDLTPVEMSQILGAYSRSPVYPEEIQDIMMTAIDKGVAADLIIQLPEYKADEYSDDEMNFIIAAGTIKDEKGVYKFSKYGIEEIIDTSNGSKRVLDYVQNLMNDYPEMTTKQILDNISGKSVSLPDKYEYPFGENGEFRKEYERIIETDLWKNFPSETQGKLFNYFRDLVNKDANRFVRLVESGYFELASEGKVDINDLLKNIGTNKFFSKQYLADVKRLSSGEPLVKEFPTGTDMQSLAKSVPEGEVGSVDGKLYVNDRGNMVELKLDKETFEKLFPLEGRFNTQQKGLGDCWLISAIDNLMDLPAGRAKIYQMFSQNGNDIQVTLPNKTTIYNNVEQPDGSYALEVAEVKNDPYIINLPGGKIPNNGHKQVKACDGVKMLEFAYSVKRSGNAPRMTPYEYEELADVSKQMESLTGGHSREFIASILGYTNDSNGNYFDSYGNIVGGVMSNAKNRNDALQMIKATANADNTLLYAATIDKAGDGSRFEKDLSPEFDLYSNHAYSVKGYDEERGLIYFTNPWNSNTVVEMDIYNFMKYIDYVNYMRL